MAFSTQVGEDSDAVKAFAREELDRAARRLVAQREPFRGEVDDGSFAAIVTASDAQLWAAIDSDVPVDE